MLVNINLLPEKEKDNKAFIIFFSITTGFAVLVLALVVGLYIYQKQQLTDIEGQLGITKQTRIKLQQQAEALTRQSEASLHYQQAADYVDSLPTFTTARMDRLTHLLPQNTSIIALDYEDNGNITIDVRFQTLNQVSDYLDRLVQAPDISQAQLINITTEASQRVAVFSVQFKATEKGGTSP